MGIRAFAAVLFFDALSRQRERPPDLARRGTKGRRKRTKPRRSLISLEAGAAARRGGEILPPPWAPPKAGPEASKGCWKRSFTLKPPNPPPTHTHTFSPRLCMSGPLGRCTGGDPRRRGRSQGRGKPWSLKETLCNSPRPSKFFYVHGGRLYDPDPPQTPPPPPNPKRLLPY